MRFMSRSLIAIVILSLTLGLLALAAGRIYTSMNERNSREERKRPQQERVFTVNVDTIKTGTASPVITAYGDISSWRTLELRTATSGRLVQIADGFRNGGFVEKDELLFQIDQADARSDVELVATQVKEAEAELLEAAAALELAEAELDAAVEQKALRTQAVARQNDLKARGVGSDAAVEAATLSRSSAVQTELSRKQAIAQAKARILRAEIGQSRQKLALDEAERRLADTSVRAPFSGLLTGVNAVQGRQVGMNEILGELIDPNALEIAFRVSGDQFSRLIDGRGQLKSIDVTATLDLVGAPIVVSGTVDRAAAEVGDGQTGRIVYAKMDPDDAKVLRPGDFMQVDIQEPPLENVVIVPATAVASNGRLLVVGDEERLEAVIVKIERRQVENVIITGAPEGRQFVTKLQPQLGAGVKVKAIGPDAVIEEKQMVTLSDEDRARYIKGIEGNAYIPKDAKERILAQLKEELVPADVVERLASRMGGGGGGGAPAPEAGGETVELDADRREKLVAFVEANQRMPAEAKERVLAQLKEDKVPASLVERLESRMGS